MQYEISKELTVLETELKNVQQWLGVEYSKISAGRIHPELLDSVMVSSYGSMQPIRNIASMSVEGPRTLRIAPWDNSTLNAIETSIRDSGIPVSLSSDSSGIRVSVHQLTEESRRDLVKLIGKKQEEARVSARSLREEIIRRIEAAQKTGEISEDEKFNAKESVQKKVDETNVFIEKLFKTKESEIMTIS